MLVAGYDPFEYVPGNLICYRKMKNILDICTIFSFVAAVCFVNSSADVAAEVVVVAVNIQTKKKKKKQKEGILIC